tara:strand:+ start:810 stop:1070 length:261 start_codon:yes stop_codon:yes gene_type:complete
MTKNKIRKIKRTRRKIVKKLKSLKRKLSLLQKLSSKEAGVDIGQHLSDVTVDICFMQEYHQGLYTLHSMTKEEREEYWKRRKGYYE